MEPTTGENKDKNRDEKLKVLRRELEAMLEDQLPSESLAGETRVEVQKTDEADLADPVKAKQIIEALLFASSKPVTVSEIRRVCRSLAAKQIEEFVQQLAAEYSSQGRSFAINQVAGGYEIATQKEFAPWILKRELQKKSKQATHSALETLAIMAYKQPVTRAEVEELRGVDVSGVLTTLIARGFIKIVGRKEVPGRPFLYATTEKFLEHFGLKGLTDLPDIGEIRAIVESSVSKESLIGTTNMVEVPAASGTETVQPEGGASQPAQDPTAGDMEDAGETERQEVDEAEPVAQEN